MIRDTSEIDRILTDTFADFKVSKGERGALQSILREASNNDLALWRSRTFVLAHTFTAKKHSESQVIDWLEDIVKLLLPRTESTREAKACFSPREDCVGTITALIGRTLRSMDLCVFTITDDRLTCSILDAHARGVRVRIMTDDDKSYDEGSDCWRMAVAGIPVFVDTSPYHMHHKFGIFDGRTILTGSYNWTRSASLHNEENLVIIEEPKLVARFEQEFHHLLDQPGTKSVIQR